MLPEDRLDSWKEIAAYLKRSVRTVRRWERNEGLPVHRHVHQELGSVYAHKSEVDAWRDDARATATPQTKSIAVLPFANLSNDADNEYFADGLTEEITTKLSKVRALRVTSRTSSRTFRDIAKDAKTIASQLGVRYLLEGSVRRAGDRLRITAQLIDAADDDHLWAETFDGTVDDIFAIQERLAILIVDALKLRLSTEEKAHLVQRSIDSVPAYDCYLRARHESWRWRKDAIDRAIHLLRDGLRIMGDNPRLYAALGLAYLQSREAGIDWSERPLIEAEACAAKVLTLDPASVSGFQLRGWILYSRAQIQEAVRDLQVAVDLDPNSADTLLLLSNCYLISGRVSAARPLIGRLMEIDPLTPVTRCLPAFADIMDGKFSESIEPYRQMFEMDASNPMARLFYIWVLILNGRELGNLLDTFPPEVRDTPPGRIAFFLSHASEGRNEEALAELSPEIEAIANATDVFPRFLAQGFALMNMADPAIDWLTIAVDRGFINYPFLAEHDRFLAPIRQNPRFSRLLEIVRKRWETFEVPSHGL